MLRTILFIPVLILVVSCSRKTTSGGGTGPGSTPVPVTPLVALPQGWKYNASYSTGLPTGMQVYSYDSVYNGKLTRAFCLAYDSKPDRFEFKPVLSQTAKRPLQFISQEPGVSYACINGGFFGGNSSYSLVKYNNSVLAPNIKSVNRDYNGISTPYFPTRAAFGVNSTGQPSVAWIYNIGAGNDNIYQYPAPSPNLAGSMPQPVPDASFPAGGSPWDVMSAVGGSPMLVKDGTILITDQDELISINNNSSRPRSAIGHTANGMVLLLAVEGDNTLRGYAGVNLQELAAMLRELGCTNAINLDGGGSTSLIIANRLTVRPGDNGVERPVASVLLIKQK